MSQKHFYEFGGFRIDLSLGRLERSGELIPLPPKAYDLLVLLARHHDRVMTKAELIESLWPKTFVEEGNLSQHVYTLRKALGDRPNGQPHIETSARRGYRLAGDVREICADSSSPRIAPGDSGSHDRDGTVALQGERKRATVLHCGLSNAAGLVERLGSAEMHELMRSVLDIGSTEVALYDGIITQRHADGFVAVFGARAVHEDDGRRAVLAVFAIQRRLQELIPVRLDTSGEERLQLQSGIHTGPLVVSRVTGSHGVDYTAIGDAVRTADLLHQYAQPGAILISEATRRSVEKHISVEPVAIPSASAAGDCAYRVTGPAGPTSAARRAVRSSAPFLGREPDTALLDRLVEQAIGGRGQVVSIVGEPGIGKSRLVGEFIRSLAGRAEPPIALEGRCVSYGTVVPYLPLSELTRAYCGVDEGDAPEVIRTSIERAVSDAGLIADASVWLWRLVGAGDGTASLDTVSPEAVKARTFDVVQGLFLKAAQRRPLVVVVEDLHWIDRTSEDFLAVFVERLVAARVMLVATHRLGYRAPWIDHSYASRITLAPLTPVDSARLVESVAGEQPLGADVARAILSRGEGNPFFLEELTRAAGEPGSGAATIPDTVQGVIMARIDRLPETSKWLLQTASILGREVPLELLSRMGSGADFSAELVELCRLEFLYERAAGDERSYVFTHALTQDVAYDSLLARDRRDLHLRAARALEALYAGRLDEITSRLAYHYARADLIDETVTWLTRAADQAARAYANAEAILHLELAARRLQRLPEGPDRDRRMLDVALRHAHSLYFLGRFRESVDVLLPHEARAARLNDPSVTAPCSFWLAHMYSRLGDQKRAVDRARHAIEAATAAGDTSTLGKAHGLLALEGHWAGNPTEGIAHGSRAVALLEDRLDQRWWLGMAHFYLATNYLLRGDFVSMLAEAARADTIGKEIGDPRLQTYAAFAAAWAEASRGNGDAAVVNGRRSLELAPDRVSRAYATLFLGYALLENGADEEARALLEPIIAELEGFSFPQWHSLAMTFASETLRCQGQREAATALIDASLETATRCQYWYGVAFAQRVAGRIARDAGAADAAWDQLQRSLQTFNRIGDVFEAAKTRLDLARSAVDRGDARCARRETIAAKRSFRTLGDSPYLERATELAADLTGPMATDAEECTLKQEIRRSGD